MKKYIYLGIVLMSNFFYAQIGVGTNNPEDPFPTQTQAKAATL